MNTSRTIAVQEKTQPGEARRAAVEMAQGLGFDAESTGNMAVIVTEAATNIVKHGGGGEIVLRPLRQENHSGVEILALDRGSGMENVGRCFQDGYTTATSPGNGLGAIARLSTLFDVYSSPKLGTVLFVPTVEVRRHAGRQICLRMGSGERADAGPDRVRGCLDYMVSMNGTAGQEIRKVQHFEYPWDHGSILVLHSDGLGTHWSLDVYPGLFGRHASVIAGVLYRDFKRLRDDATVVVVRQSAATA